MRDLNPSLIFSRFNPAEHAVVDGIVCPRSRMLTPAASLASAARRLMARTAPPAPKVATPAPTRSAAVKSSATPPKRIAAEEPKPTPYVRAAMAAHERELAARAASPAPAAPAASRGSGLAIWDRIRGRR